MCKVLGPSYTLKLNVFICVSTAYGLHFYLQNVPLKDFVHSRPPIFIGWFKKWCSINIVNPWVVCLVDGRHKRKQNCTHA